MRVLETETPPAYKMGKNKKHRLRKSKENEAGASDSSEEGATGPAVCSHVNKAVNFAAMKKAILKSTFGECGICSKDVAKGGQKDFSAGAVSCEVAVEEAGEAEMETTVWVCLQCGNQGCDRNSRDKHALRHYETPHSGIHSVVVNLTTWAIWCYSCDDEIHYESFRRIQECVDFLRKQAGLLRTDAIQLPGRRGRVESTSEQQAVVKDKGRALTQRTTVASPSSQKVKGLSNLGNTCFFNAVMQNLSQTHSLENLFGERTKKGRVLSLPGRSRQGDSDTSGSSEGESEDETSKELPSIEITPSDPGPLTQALLSFLQEMENNCSRSTTVNPSSLFGQVCKKAPRFKGYQQQDSHELLRYLLDVIRTEEIKRGQFGILRYFKLPESTNPKKVDEDTKMKIKEYGRQVKHTFLDSLFGGQLVSTVMCEECKHISQIFEPFLDLSLPVTEEKPQRPNLMLGGRKKDSIEIEEVKGVDGFAERLDKPSKYAMKKNKKQAKREAKVKRKEGKLVKQLSLVSADETATKDEARNCEGEEDDREEQEVQEKKKVQEEEGKEKADSQSSEREDPSDADVEDNLESDTSRLQPPATTKIVTSCHHSQDIKHKTSLAALDSGGSSTCTVRSSFNTASNISGSGSMLSSEVSLKNISAAENGECEEVICGIQSLSISQYQGIDGDVIQDSETHSCTKDMSPSTGKLEIKPGHVENQKYKEDSYSLHDADSQEKADTLGIGRTGVTEVKDLHQNSLIDPVANSTSAACTADSGILTESLMSESVDIGEQLPDNVNVVETDPFVAASALSNCTDSGIQVGDLTKDKEITCDKVLNGETETCCSDDKTTMKINGDIASGIPTSQAEDVIVNGQSGRHSPRQQKSKKELKKQAQYKSMSTLSPRYHPSPKECSVMSCLHQFTSAELLTGTNKFGCHHCTRTKHKNSVPKDKKGSETVYSNASKQYLIFLPPAILTLHLKRFEQVGFNSRKVNRHVDFPFLLDLGPYCSSLCQGMEPGQKRIVYSLYGVVEHSGRLSGGHYTAYVKVRPSLAAVSNCRYLRTQNPTPKDYIHHYTEHMLNDPKSLVDEISDEFLESLVPPGKWYHISDSRVSESQESTVQRAQAYLLFYERIY